MIMVGVGDNIWAVFAKKTFLVRLPIRAVPFLKRRLIDELLQAPFWRQQKTTPIFYPAKASDA